MFRLENFREVPVWQPFDLVQVALSIDQLSGYEQDEEQMGILVTANTSGRPRRSLGSVTFAALS